LEKIFRIGREWERPNVRWLQDADIKVREVGDKRFHWKEYNIVGYMDADIVIPEIDPDLRIPLEHKTVSPDGFRAIKKCKENGIPLTQAKQIWVRKYPGQIMIYDLFKEVDVGAWFFFEKSSGDFLWWLSMLDYEYAETLIKRAERCEENVAKNFIPEPVTKEICNRCDFAFTYCFPDKDYGPGFVFLTNQEAADYLDQRDAVLEPHQKFTPLDKLIKGHFKGQNVVIEGKRGTYKIETKIGDKRTVVSIEKI